MNCLRLFLLALLLPMMNCVAVQNVLRKKPKTTEAKTQVAKPTLIGLVELVNPEAKFIIVHLNANSPVPPGTELICVGAAGQSAKVKVTPERKTIFITADIVSGTPQKGDSVLQGQVAATPAAEAEVIVPGDQGRPTISISPGATQPLPPPVAPAEFLRPVPSNQ